MKDEDFNGLLRGLSEARDHARGRKVEGLRIHEGTPLDISAIRKRTGLSQTSFARQIGVSPGTLRNWEQGRRRPEGPARVLLAMLARDPHVVSRMLSAA
jgi:putative transcriptional regulator